MLEHKPEIWWKTKLSLKSGGKKIKNKAEPKAMSLNVFLESDAEAFR